MEAPVRTQLRDAQYSLGNEEYNKFAASLAEDPRIMTHLPGLAINALQDYSDSPRVSHSIDTNQTGTVSKREVRAAAGDPSKFDPVHRKALPYVVDNFEKFRELNPNDGDFIGNNWDITHLDLRVGLDQIILRDSAKKSVSDMKLVHHNFDKVDVNQSGKITNS
jgi:hypothetical protein